MHIRPNLAHDACELVTHDEATVRLLVPTIYMQLAGKWWRQSSDLKLGPAQRKIGKA